jgi:hypothetical protein
MFYFLSVRLLASILFFFVFFSLPPTDFIIFYRCLFHICVSKIFVFSFRRFLFPSFSSFSPHSLCFSLYSSNSFAYTPYPLPPYFPSLFPPHHSIVIISNKYIFPVFYFKFCILLSFLCFFSFFFVFQLSIHSFFPFISFFFSVLNPRNKNTKIQTKFSFSFSHDFPFSQQFVLLLPLSLPISFHIFALVHIPDAFSILLSLLYVPGSHLLSIRFSLLSPLHIKKQNKNKQKNPLSTYPHI